MCTSRFFHRESPGNDAAVALPRHAFFHITFFFRLLISLMLTAWMLMAVVPARAGQGRYVLTQRTIQDHSGFMFAGRVMTRAPSYPKGITIQDRSVASHKEFHDEKGNFYSRMDATYTWGPVPDTFKPGETFRLTSKMVVDGAGKWSYRTDGISFHLLFFQNGEKETTYVRNIMAGKRQGNYLWMKRHHDFISDPRFMYRDKDRSFGLKAENLAEYRPLMDQTWTAQSLSYPKNPAEFPHALISIKIKDDELDLWYHYRYEYDPTGARAPSAIEPVNRSSETSPPPSPKKTPAAPPRKAPAATATSVPAAITTNAQSAMLTQPLKLVQVHTRPGLYSVTSKGNGAWHVQKIGHHPGGVQNAGMMVALSSPGWPVKGDFDASVRISDARIQGPGLNQIEFQASFSGHLFFVVRDKTGKGCHVWAPGSQGNAPAGNDGVLRITRKNGKVTGFINDRIIWSTQITAPLNRLQFVLQNNHSNDPISVSFSEFTFRVPKQGADRKLPQKSQQLAVPQPSGQPDTLNPEAEKFVEKGESLFNAKNFSSAEIAFRNACKLDPGHSNALRGVARCRNKAGDHEKANVWIAKSLAANPSNYLAYLTRGNIRRDTGDYQGAIADYTQSAKIKPDYRGAYNNRGLVYKRMKRYDKARQDFEQALKISPNYVYALNNLGDLYQTHYKDYPKALKYFNQSLASGQGNVFAFHHRALVYEHLKKPDQAIQDLRAAEAKAPRNTRVLLDLGRLLDTYKKDYTQALAVNNRILAIDPNKGEAYNNRATNYLHLNQNVEAIKNFQRAHELLPDNTVIKKNLDIVRKAFPKEAKAADASPLPRPPASPAKGKVQAYIETPGPAKNQPKLKTGTTGASLGTGPEISPAPAAASIPALKFSATDPCNQKEWRQPGVLWGAEDEGSGAQGTLPAGLDIPVPKELSLDKLSKAQYQGEVSLAKEQMRMLYGELAPQTAAAFETAWAPLYDYPSQEIIDYLNRLNPLLAKFLACRTAFVQAAAAFQYSLLDAAMAVEFDSENDLVRIASEAQQHKDNIISLQMALASTAARIETLGNPPNPLEIKCKDRKRGLLEGQGPGLMEDGPIFRVFGQSAEGKAAISVSKRNLERRKDEKVLWHVDDKSFEMVEMSEWFGAPRCGFHPSSCNTVQNGNKEFRHTIRGRFSKHGKIITELVATRETQTCKPVLKQVGINQYNLPVYAVQDITDTGAVVIDEIRLENIPLSRFKLTDGKSGQAMEMDQTGAGATPFLTHVKGGAKGGDPEVYVSWGVSPFNSRAKSNFGRNLIATGVMGNITGSMAGNLSTGCSRGKNTVELKPVMVMVKGKPEKNQALEDEIKFHEAAINIIQTNIKKDKAELDALLAKPDPHQHKDQIQALQWRLINATSNLSSEKDYITSLVRGELVHTRTAFDEYASQRFIHTMEIEARRRDEAQRMAGRMERLIAQLPEDQQEQKRKIVHRLLRESNAVAAGDVEKIHKIAASLNEQIQGHWEGQAAEAEVEAINAMEADYYKNVGKMMFGIALTGLSGPAFAEYFGEAALLTAWAPTTTGMLFGGATGFAEDGVTGAVRGVASWSSQVGFLTVEFYDGYMGHDGTRGGIYNGLKKAGTAALMGAAMNLGFKVIGAGASKVAERLKKIGGKKPGVRQQFEMAKMKEDIKEAEYFVNAYTDRAKAMADAVRRRAPKGEIAAIQTEMDRLAANINGCFHCKWYFKYKGQPWAQRAFNKNVNKFYDQSITRMRTRLEGMGYDTRNLNWEKIRNASSGDSVGMDLDLALREFDGLVIVKNGKPISMANARKDFQHAMDRSYHEVSGVSASRSDILVTDTKHAEAFFDKGLLSRDINWSNIDPRRLPQAGDVARYKTWHIKDDATMGEFTKIQATCRSAQKDIQNRLLPFLERKSAFAHIRDVKRYEEMLAFWRNIEKQFKRIGQNETDPMKIWELTNQLRAQTGGRGPYEIVENIGTTIETLALFK